MKTFERTFLLILDYIWIYMFIGRTFYITGRLSSSVCARSECISSNQNASALSYTHE